MYSIIPECSTSEQYYSSIQPSCKLSPLLDRYTYNSKFHTKFAFINESHLNDVILTVSENVSRIVPFYLEDGEDNGGSLMLSGHMQDYLSIQVCIAFKYGCVGSKSVKKCCC